MLSKQAEEILLLMRQPSESRVPLLLVVSDAGRYVHAGGKTLGDKDPRTARQYVDALRNLTANDLMEQVDREAFDLTTRGFEMADALAAEAEAEHAVPDTCALRIEDRTCAVTYFGVNLEGQETDNFKVCGGTHIGDGMYIGHAGFYEVLEGKDKQVFGVLLDISHIPPFQDQDTVSAQELNVVFKRPGLRSIRDNLVGTCPADENNRLVYPDMTNTESLSEIKTINEFVDAADDPRVDILTDCERDVLGYMDEMRKQRKPGGVTVTGVAAWPTKRRFYSVRDHIRWTFDDLLKKELIHTSDGVHHQLVVSRLSDIRRVVAGLPSDQLFDAEPLAQQTQDKPEISMGSAELPTDKGTTRMSAINVNVRVDTEGDTRWVILTLSAPEGLPVCLKKGLWFVNADNDSLVEIRPLLISKPSTDFPEALTQQHPQQSLTISLKSIVDQIEKAVGSVPDPITFVVKSDDGTEHRSKAMSLTTGKCVNGDAMTKMRETVEFTDYEDLLRLIAEKCQQHRPHIARLSVIATFDSDTITLDVNATESSRALVIFFTRPGSGDMQPFRHRLIQEYWMSGDATNGIIDYENLLEENLKAAATQDMGHSEDPDATRDRILRAIIRLQGASANYVRDESIAQQVDLAVEDVRGHLDILENEDRVKVARTSSGHSAFLSPGQRQIAKEAEMPIVQNRVDQSRERNVFVVHGHDEALKEKVARFLEKLDLEPILLSEQPGRGRTLIKKFEDHSLAASVAVVLLTADDTGKANTEEDPPHPRARQNVVLELGYFIGKLGRQCVIVLKDEGVEEPSDFHGVEYVPVDPHGGWRTNLARELQAAGLPIDMNKVL